MEVLRLARRIAEDRVTDIIGVPQFEVLTHLHDRGSTTPGELARLESVTPPAVNRTVNALEAAGFVQRVGDPDDGRRIIVEVTDAGHALIEETRRKRNARMHTEFAGLSRDDRAALRRVTKLMSEMLRR
ncbi:MAG: MarR family transcriptional regulator [Cryobacterium sp.]|nr:MarR family transcriptional regulator [Cryobacterium sp.]